MSTLINRIEKIYDGIEVITKYPDTPRYIEELPKCAVCGKKVQFVHFLPETSKRLESNSQIQLFCSVLCKDKQVEAETMIFFPCMCRDCWHQWFVKRKDGKEVCPCCGSESTNKGIK